MCTQRSFISSGVEEEAGVDPEANNDLDVTTVADRGSEPLLRSAYVHPGDTPPKVRAERYEARAADNDDDVTAADADSPTVLFTNGADSVAINHNSSQNNAAAGATAAKNSWADVTADTVRLPPVTIVPRDDSSLSWRRFWALSRIKWLFLKRNRELLVYRIVIPLVMILAGAAVGSFVSLTSNDTSDDSVALTLTASVYARVDDQSADEPNMTYAYGGTAPEADEILFTQQLQQNGVYLTETNDSYDFLNSEHYFHMGLTIFNATFVTSAADASGDDVGSANFTARYNDSAMHSLPVVQNTLTNAALGALGHSGVNVTAHAQRFANLEMDNIGWSNSVFWATFLLGMALSFPPATLALFVVKEREVSTGGRQGERGKHCLSSRRER